MTASGRRRAPGEGETLGDSKSERTRGLDSRSGPTTNLREALRALHASLRADHDAMLHYRGKYGTRKDSAGLGRDLLEKVGFQIVGAYRVMRFLDAVHATTGAKVASRVIRHLYGSDIHWDADLAPGVMVVHGMGMAISHSARIGPRVILFQHCTVGEGRHPDTGAVGSPVLEEEVVVGAGAVILGPVTVGARTKIMPGCVVVRSVPPDSIVEVPPSKVRARGPRDPTAKGVA